MIGSRLASPSRHARAFVHDSLTCRRACLHSRVWWGWRRLHLYLDPATFASASAHATLSLEGDGGEDGVGVDGGGGGAGVDGGGGEAEREVGMLALHAGPLPPVADCSSVTFLSSVPVPTTGGVPAPPDRDAPADYRSSGAGCGPGSLCDDAVAGSDDRGVGSDGGGGVRARGGGSSARVLALVHRASGAVESDRHFSWWL